MENLHERSISCGLHTASHNCTRLFIFLAQGMPVVPAEPVVTAACFFCCRRAMGAACIRHSLRPLTYEGGVRWLTRACRAAGRRSRGCNCYRPIPREAGMFATASLSLGLLGRGGFSGRGAVVAV